MAARRRSACRAVHLVTCVITDGTKLGVVFTEAFDSMQLHVDLLSRAELRKDDIWVCREGWVAGHDCLLFALGDPLEL